MMSLAVAQFGQVTDRRIQARAQTILAYGKLVVSNVEHICKVRDISARGMRIQANDIPEIGTPVSIEMRGLPPSSAIIVWRKGDAAGMAFQSEQDMQRIFESRRGDASNKPRGPRFSVRMLATLDSPEGNARLEVVDISMGGLKLAGTTDLPVGSHGRIQLAGLEEGLAGHIRWKQGDALGFRFNRPMLGNDLLHILDLNR